MKRLPLLTLLVLVPACRNPTESNGEGAHAGAPAATGPAPLVTGTVLDARTGKPVAGARVVGPGGVEAKSDAQGHFVLRGLALGAEGELVGTEAGRTGKNRLRALASGPLEVVLYLR